MLLCSLLGATGAEISCLCLTFPHFARLFYPLIEAKDGGSTLPLP